MKKNAIYCDRCGKEVYPRTMFNLRGRQFKTVVETTVKCDWREYFSFPSEKTYDLCHECNTELRKFLGVDECTSVPHVNYRPNNDKVFYLCDRKACSNCSDTCGYTSDINHAVNFHVQGEAIFENGPQVEEPVFEGDGE